MIQSTDVFFFYFDAVVGGLFLIAAWTNFVGKRISRFGLDAFIFSLYSIIRREKVAELQLRENPAFIQRMGLLTLILGFSFLNATIEQLKIIWPYIH